MVLGNFHTETFCAVYGKEVFSSPPVPLTGLINPLMAMFYLNQHYQHRVQHILCTQVQVKVMSSMLLHMLENHQTQGGDQAAYLVHGLKSQHLTSHHQQLVHAQ